MLCRSIGSALLLLPYWTYNLKVTLFTYHPRPHDWFLECNSTLLKDSFLYPTFLLAPSNCIAVCNILAACMLPCWFEQSQESENIKPQPPRTGWMCWRHPKKGKF